jgi:hypothetical protein
MIAHGHAADIGASVFNIVPVSKSSNRLTNNYFDQGKTLIREVNSPEHCHTQLAMRQEIYLLAEQVYLCFPIQSDRQICGEYAVL